MCPGEETVGLPGGVPPDEQACAAGTERPELRPRRELASTATTIEPPTFAVVIPTYQREETLGRALESAMRQTFSASEIIVVDDGSTIARKSVSKSFPLGVSVRNRGPVGAAARNRGVREASAHVDCLLGLGRLVELDHLERLASAIEKTDGAADLYFDDTAAVMHTFQPDGDEVHVGSLWEFAGSRPQRL